MDPIKEAFFKIKQEIEELRNEILSLKERISEINLQTKQTNSSTIPSSLQDTPTHLQTVPQEMRGSDAYFSDSSTGNEGVQTDISTYRQTSQQTGKTGFFPLYNKGILSPHNLQETLETLDSIKKEIRLKFKRLTPQEMSVFTALYSLQNQGFTEITYKIISQELNLSESSIRDYVSKIISKGIPVKKERLNNKKILISVSQDLQKIASLSTIIKLRDL